jgi:hypothetical protein
MAAANKRKYMNSSPYGVYRICEEILDFNVDGDNSHLGNLTALKAATPVRTRSWGFPSLPFGISQITTDSLWNTCG